MPTPDRLLWRVSESAERLAICRSKTYELIAAGEIPAVIIGGSIRVPRDALRNWIAKKTGEREASK